MAITQISKIQVRSGNIDDLPQLDVGEFGWATDTRALFIGNDTSNIIGPQPDNTEILTVASDIPAAGSNGQIQFNNNGVLGGSPKLTFSDVDGNLVLEGNINIDGNIVLNNSGALVSNIISTGGASLPGTVIGNWSLSTGSRLEATYADIGERYISDKQYEPGTVLSIDGIQEVTIANHSNKYKIAGVVSTTPAYVLNSMAENSVIIGLTGRVPCKVVGNITKGDFMIISDIPGVGTGTKLPVPGAVFGRALQDYSSTKIGIIEIKLDRG